MKNLIISFLFLVVLSVDFSVAQPYEIKYEIEGQDILIMDSLSVRDFIAIISMESCDSNVFRPIETFHPSSYYFLTKDDIDFLISIIDSDTPSVNVVSVFSSTIPDIKYTTGDVAMNMLEYFRNPNKHHYPPLWISKNYKEEEKEEMRKWYQDWKELN